MKNKQEYEGSDRSAAHAGDLSPLSILDHSRQAAYLLWRKTQDKNIEEILFPVKSFSHISSSRSDFKSAEGSEKGIILSKRTKVANICFRLNVRKTSTTLFTSAPISLSMLQVQKNVKLFKILLSFFVFITTFPHTQSSVVAFIPSPSLSACCLLNLSSQGDHFDFSSFFLHSESSKPYYI